MQTANDFIRRNSLHYFLSSFSDKLLMTSFHKPFVGSCTGFVLPLRNQLTDESGRNPFPVDAVFTHRYVVFQVLFMHTPKRA
jgi:hypothetical protein